MWAKVRSTERYSTLAVMNLPFLIPVYVFHSKLRHHPSFYRTNQTKMMPEYKYLSVENR